MRAFVAGATGYTGRAVVAQLCADGHEVVAHIRPDSPRRTHWQELFANLPGSERLTVDLTAWTSGDMNATLARVQPDLVFALLGTTASRKKVAAAQGRDPNAESYERVDYGLTALLIEASVACGSAPRFVYLSSLGVRKGGPGAYLLARWKTEEALRATTLAWTIARPSFITGDNRDEDRFGERFGAGMADAGLRGLAALGMGGLLARYGSMRNDELASGLIRHALDPESACTVVEAIALRHTEGA